jgi:hypothetical protein
VAEVVSESQWQKDVRKTAHSYGWRSYYTPYSLGASPGWPDLVLVKPPRVVFTELKVRTGKLRPAQEETRDLLERCEVVEYHLWRPADEAEVLEVLGANIRQGRLL